MSKVFISYRREDSADVTGRIGDRLRSHFGDDNIFTDVDDIPLGVDFRIHLDAAVGQCDVLLAVIGRDWLSVSNSDNELRLDDPADFVRIEIESALQRDIPVIPLLVRGATMPRQNQLPESIQSLAFRNAQPVRPDPDFRNDAERLIRSLDQHLEAGNSAALTDAPQIAIEGDEVDYLKTLRNELLLSKSETDYKGLKFKLEKYLVEHPKNVEARMLLDRVETALARNYSPPDLKTRSGKSMWMGSVAAIVGAVGLYVVLSGRPIDDSPVAVSTSEKPAIETPTDFIPPDMVQIPAGTFMMGSDTGKDDERPIHEVTLPAFELARNELTWAEWQMCEDDGGCREIDRPSFLNDFDASIQVTNPVVNVNITSVNEYIKWIREKTGRTYRLPSEAEWEYAARAGSTTQYFWGDEVGENQANCDGCGSQWDDRSTAPVGSFGENSFGLNDVHGNVWEWVADCWHGNYEGAPMDGAARVENCAFENTRVLRGGSWNGVPEYLRSANRLSFYTDNAFDDVGFRLARTLP